MDDTYTRYQPATNRQVDDLRRRVFSLSERLAQVEDQLAYVLSTMEAKQ